MGNNNLVGTLIQAPPQEMEPWNGQPRTEFDDELIEQMAESFKTSRGVVTPLLIRPHPKPRNGVKYQIIAGERRWRAAMKAELPLLDAVLREVKDEDMLEIAVIENLHRRELNPIEEARAFKRLMKENSWTAKQLAKRLGKSTYWITTQRLSLLKLAPEVQQMVLQNKLPISTALNLNQYANHRDQLRLARIILERGMTAAQVSEQILTMGRSMERQDGMSGEETLHLQRRRNLLKIALSCATQLSRFMNNLNDEQLAEFLTQIPPIRKERLEYLLKSIKGTVEKILNILDGLP